MQQEENGTEHAAVQGVVSSRSVGEDRVVPGKASTAGGRIVGAQPNLEKSKKEDLALVEDGEEFAMFGFGC